MPMQETDLLSIIANFGFPMALSWYLLLRMERKLDMLTEVINRLSNLLNEKIK